MVYAAKSSWSVYAGYAEVRYTTARISRAANHHQNW